MTDDYEEIPSLNVYLTCRWSELVGAHTARLSVLVKDRQWDIDFIPEDAADDPNILSYALRCIADSIARDVSKRMPHDN